MPTYQQKANLYRSLGVQISAGVLLSEALKTSARHSGFQSLDLIRKKLLSEGAALSKFLRLFPNEFSNLEIELISLGESSGTLAENFNHLATWFDLLHSIRRDVNTSLFYPLLLVHLAPPISALPELVASGCVSCFVRSILVILLPLDIFLFILFKGLPWTRKHLQPFALFVDHSALSIPVLGTAITNLEMARYTLALSYCLDSGMGVFESLNASQNVVSNLKVRNRLGMAPQKVKKGATLTSALLSSKMFSSMAGGILKAGEVSGKNVEMLRKLHEYYFADFQTTMSRVSKLLPVVALLLAGILIGVKVILSYKRMLNSIPEE